MSNYVSPLSVFFVWHPLDNEAVGGVVDECLACLRRDVDRPFSRELNVPVFLRTSELSRTPRPIQTRSKHSLVFAFIGKNCVSDDAWVDYLEGIAKTEGADFVPIALDNTAFNFSEGIERVNFIRAYDFPNELFTARTCVEIFHEIYRYGLNESREELERGKDSSLKLFLSHAKDRAQGVAAAIALKQLIDSGAMREFFDATDIAAGYEFEGEILAHIQDSTVVAIHSDSYSSRYWCQREILAAKDFDRPIVAIDLVNSFEDRRFPLGGNVPALRIPIGPDDEIQESDLFAILQAALLETIRSFYAKESLRASQSADWFSADAFLSSRPPEACVMARLAGEIEKDESRSLDFVYPDPPIYPEEARHFSKFGLNAFTPLTSENPKVAGKKVGVSISEPSDTDLLEIGQTSQHLSLLMQDIARYGLCFGAELVYGGDLRPGGFTEFLFQEGHALQSRIRSLTVQLTNHIAWPIHLAADADLQEWKARNRNIAKMVEHDIPADVMDLIEDQAVFVAPTEPPGSFVWSRSLSEMRRAMITECDIRISAGGRLTGYKGWMPGVLEEIAISIQLEKPLFLLGGFGGVTRSVCRLIVEKEVPEELTLDWQREHNPGLADMLELSATRGFDYAQQYQEVMDTVMNADLRNGLTTEENARLFDTPFADEVIHLVLKGIGQS